jgi:hypothetical protein
MRSGLVSVFEGHSLLLTMSEIGALSARTRVRIQFHSDTDALVATTEGVLRRGSPVRLELAVPRGAGRVQARVTVTLIGPSNQDSAAVAVLEDIDPVSQTVGVRNLCGPPSDRDGAQTICPGWEIDTLAIGD